MHQITKSYRVKNFSAMNSNFSQLERLNSSRETFGHISAFERKNIYY